MLLQILVLQVIHGVFGRLNIENCTLDTKDAFPCYHCDTSNDPHCGNPFQFSHYYRIRQRDVYLIECQGCCIKIVHPSVNGTERIQRSCTDMLPNDLAFELEENCENREKEEDVRICLCQKGLCNSSSKIFAISHISLMFFSLLLLLTYQQIKT